MQFETPKPMPDIKDCYFYHTIDLPGHDTINGSWDLRANINDYLGFVDFKNKRVLDVGTATGFLAFEAEKRGASEVIGFDLSQDENWDYVPYSPELARNIFGHSIDELMVIKKQSLKQMYNGFWFSHNTLKSKVNLYYGKAYNIPKEIGKVDISIFGSILLHMRNPLDSLIDVAGITRETIIVTDLLHDGINQYIPSIELIPSVEQRPLVVDTWWKISPAFISNFLQILGFTEIKINYHEQYRTDMNNLPHKFFTVVGQKTL